jgi:hypothetical protein
MEIALQDLAGGADQRRLRDGDLVTVATELDLHVDAALWVQHGDVVRPGRQVGAVAGHGAGQGEGGGHPDGAGRGVRGVTPTGGEVARGDAVLVGAGTAITGLGMTFSVTSPSPISRPAVRRNDSSRSSRVLSASSWSGVSRPVTPMSLARMIISGMAASRQVTSTPSMTSMRCPVGKTEPVTAPQASRKFSRIGAAVPATPSIRAAPA